MTDSNDNADPNLALDDKGTTDNDSGISGISRVRGLRMKSFSLKLTENPQEARGIKVVSCGAEIKYLLVFERDFTVDETGQKELAELRQGLFRQDRGLKHRFYDEDNALIPFCVGNQSQEFGAYHIVGGQEAITGVEGEAIRVLVVFEATLYSNQGATKIKDVFTGQNYTAEHPLKKAKRMVVSLR